MYSKQFIESLAEFICGDDVSKYPEYRSSYYLTSFFQSIDIDVIHDGTTRKIWVRSVLEKLTFEEIEKIVKILVSPKLYKNKEQVKLAIDNMKELLLYENKTIEFSGLEPHIIEYKTTIDDILGITKL